MLGRKNYRSEELDHAKKAVDQQLAAYKKFVKAVEGATSDPKVTAAHVPSARERRLRRLRVDVLAKMALR